jgi:ribose transport system permease protein
MPELSDRFIATKEIGRTSSFSRNKLMVKRKGLRALKQSGPAIALLLLFAGFSLLTPKFATLENLQTLLETSAVPLILAVGITFVVIQGSIDLSVEGITATVSMSLSLLVANGINSNNLGVTGIVIALSVGVIFGVGNGFVYTFGRLPSLIVTLGSWFMGLGFASLLFPQRLPEIRDSLVTGLALNRLCGLNPITYAAFLIVVGAHILLKYTQFGRMTYAIGGDESVAQASGIKIWRYKVLAFGLSGLLASVSGIFLTAQLGYGEANTGEGMLFPAISAAVVGGTLLSGGRGGAFQTSIGVFILAVLTNGMIQIGAGPYTRQIIEGGAIVVAVAAGNWHLRSKLRVAK